MINGTDDFVGIKLAAPQQVPQKQAQQMMHPAPQQRAPRPQQPMPNQQPMQGQQMHQPQMRRPMPNGGGMPMHPQGHPHQRMPQPQQQHVTLTSIAQQDFNEEDIRELYGEVNAATKIKLENYKV